MRFLPIGKGRKIFQKTGLILFGLISLVFAILVVRTDAWQFSAGILPPGWDEPFDQVEDFISPPEGNAVDKVKRLFWDNIVPLFKYIMVAVSIIFFVLYLYQMLISSGDEEAIGSSKKNMLWGVLGFMIIAIAMDLANAFDVWRNQGEFVNRELLEDAQLRAVSYFQLIAGIVAFFFIFYSGFRLVTSAGDEEIIKAQKNHIKWGFVGLIFVMLADVAVNMIFYPAEGQRGLGRSELSVLFREGVGVLKFFLAFVGILATVSFLASGVAYITAAGDEGITGKAKKNIIGSAIAIIIIVTSYILVVSFVPPGPPQA